MHYWRSRACSYHRASKDPLHWTTSCNTCTISVPPRSDRRSYNVAQVGKTILRIDNLIAASYVLIFFFSRELLMKLAIASSFLFFLESFSRLVRYYVSSVYESEIFNRKSEGFLTEIRKQLHTYTSICEQLIFNNSVQSLFIYKTSICGLHETFIKKNIRARL